jgi:ORF6N domain-containing protein
MPLETLILSLRRQKVLLDADLAALYAVPTKALNQAVKRNSDRFPSDFVFQLLPREMADLRSQFATAGEQDPVRQYDGALRSQFVTLKPGRGQHRKYLPYAFTEHGAIMAATVLNSPRAVSMSLYIVRTFIQMREQIVANAEVLKRLAEIDHTLLKHDKSLQIIWRELQPLLRRSPVPPKRQIGFHSS